MKAFLKTFAFFLCCAPVMYVILLVAWGMIPSRAFKKNLNYQVEYDNLYPRVRDARVKGQVDVLIVGSSHAYRGMDPRLFEEKGITAFNLGSSAQSPMQTKLLLERYLENLNPKLVIFEVYPVAFFGEGIESALDLISNDELDFATFKMCIRLNNIKVYNTYLYALLQTPSAGKLSGQPAKSGNDYVEGTGFVEKEMSFNSKVYTPERSLKWPVDHCQLEEFDKCVTLLRNHDIKYVLVQAPITSMLYNKYKNNREVDSIFNSLGPYKNFNGVVTLSDSLDFYDDDHLNQNGVRKFNAQLIDFVSTYIPPNE